MPICPFSFDFEQATLKAAMGLRFPKSKTVCNQIWLQRFGDKQPYEFVNLLDPILAQCTYCRYKQ
ncbi:MAG: hypothetical protein Kow00121_55750 [Elainellaceae cyanobacterium]